MPIFAKIFSIVCSAFMPFSRGTRCFTQFCANFVMLVLAHFIAPSNLTSFLSCYLRVRATSSIGLLCYTTPPCFFVWKNSSVANNTEKGRQVYLHYLYYIQFYSLTHSLVTSQKKNYSQVAITVDQTAIEGNWDLWILMFKNERDISA